MKSRIAVIIIVLMACLSGKAQEYINIDGTQFFVELNYPKATAVITDNKVDLDKNSYIYTSRKIKNINKDTKTLEIPQKVTINNREYTITGIGHGAFAHYRNFNKVVIPSTVTHIDDYAFYNTNITTLSVPSSVTSIGEYAFALANIEYVVLPTSLTSIGEYAFAHTKLEDVVLPFSVISVGEGAFDGCGKLKRLCVPQHLMGGIQAKDVNKNFKITLNYVGDSELAQMAATSQQPEEEPEPMPEAPVMPKVKVTSSDVEINIPHTSEVAENTFAFIIANEKYQNDPDVEYALQDGRTFREYCSRTLGIPDENIRYFENATLNNLRGVVDRMKSTAEIYGNDAKLIFYFTGHGVPDKDGNGYLLPTDGSASDSNSGYSLKQLYSSLGNLEAGNVLVFLDACFSGRQRDEAFLVEGTKGGLRRTVNEAPATGRMVVFSASKGEETAHAYPEKGHSLFTYYLLKKLKESRGELKLGELADYIYDNVRKKAFSVLDTSQNPTVQVSPTIQTEWQQLSVK